MEARYGERVLKRGLEVAIATSALALSAPLTLGAAALVGLEGGEPIFRQQRVGRGRGEFSIYKLRTMKDGSVTRTGRWLRATGIDELPQLLNVLRGDMSLVGPRPLTPQDIKRLGWDDSRFDPRWSVRPGITGTAQLHGGACDKRISWLYDRAYVREQRTSSDLGILIATGLCAFVGKRRVRSLLRRARR